MVRERVDVHRPAEMIPSDYRYLASSYPVETHEGTDVEWDGTEEWETLGRPYRSTCEHAVHLQCDHCGARHKYQTILLYAPTGEILSVGQTCATERFGRSDWKNVIADGARRAELKAERERKAAAALAALSTMAPEALAAFQWARDEETANPIARDMVSKVERFGPLTERQVSFLIKLHAETLEKVRAVEQGDIAPCPSGRQEITGTILSAKQVLDEFASSRYHTAYKTKILVQDDRGFRVYGSMPSALSTPEGDLKGKRVRFTAAVEPKKEDPTFGFFLRPSKASYLTD